MEAQYSRILVAVPVLALTNRVASLSRAIPLSCKPIGESLHGVPFLPTCERVRLIGLRVPKANKQVKAMLE